MSVDFEVPIGFENGIKISYANQGHSDTEGSRGDAELSVFYKVPSGIKVDFSNGNVEHVLEVSIDQVLDTFSETIQCPSGEMVEVSFHLVQHAVSMFVRSWFDLCALCVCTGILGSLTYCGRYSWRWR